MMKIDLLKEPAIEFSDGFLCDDPKTGLSARGFFSVTTSTHRSEIHYSVIGTKKNIEATLSWIQSFENRIEGTADVFVDKKDTVIEDGEIVDPAYLVETLEKLFAIDAEGDGLTYTQNKKLNPDFPGFTKDSIFQCSFLNDEPNNKSFKDSAIDEIIKSDKKFLEKARDVARLYIDEFSELVNDSINKPNVCFIIIPTKVYNSFSSIPIGGNTYFNLRRYLKAKLLAIPNSIPVQIILEDTVKGTKKNMQDLSMQAWNFIVANYYKNNGTPWSLTLKNKNTCFIGISFNKVISSDDNLVRASVAQAFNYEGKGIVFIGKQFRWDDEATNTKSPHLTYEYASDLIQAILKEYKKFNVLPPTRVVIHKTTYFWDSSIHKDYAEVEGIKDGIQKELNEDAEIDFVTLKSSSIKLLRETGLYPVIRGTYLELDEATALLYTTGYIPYYETFPGVHIPRALEVSIYEGDTTIRNVCSEILALTKMNFNNCNYYDSLPITLRFAQKVGEIVQYLDEGITPPNRYYFYM
jgi:hypothetical protein